MNGSLWHSTCVTSMLMMSHLFHWLMEAWFYLHCKPLPTWKVNSYRCLGVSTLNWSMQVLCVCKKARQKIGVLYRKFYHADTPTLQQLYILYIRPHFKYAVLVWDPYQLGLVNTLENVQKFALKVCTKVEIRLWKHAHFLQLDFLG